MPPKNDLEISHEIQRRDCKCIKHDLEISSPGMIKEFPLPLPLLLPWEIPSPDCRYI